MISVCFIISAKPCRPKPTQLGEEVYSTAANNTSRARVPVAVPQKMKPPMQVQEIYRSINSMVR
jgi:hypothetical protein